MGIIYKKDGKERIIGISISYKFGKGSTKQDKCESAITSLVDILKKLGVSVVDTVNEPKPGIKKL